jgi:hypothetical protein
MLFVADVKENVFDDTTVYCDEVSFGNDDTWSGETMAHI